MKMNFLNNKTTSKNIDRYQMRTKIKMYYIISLFFKNKKIDYLYYPNQENISLKKTAKKKKKIIDIKTDLDKS